MKQNEDGTVTAQGGEAVSSTGAWVEPLSTPDGAGMPGSSVMLNSAGQTIDEVKRIQAERDAAVTLAEQDRLKRIAADYPVTSIENNQVLMLVATEGASNVVGRVLEAIRTIRRHAERRGDTVLTARLGAQDSVLRDAVTNLSEVETWR